MDDLETQMSQHDESHEPEEPPASPKRHKKMWYDKSPVPLQERTRGMSRRVTNKNGKG